MNKRIHALCSMVQRTVWKSPELWARACHVSLRPYQQGILDAIKDSIIHGKGLTFVVILPRQSGKNELQAHLFSWLLFRYASKGGCMVSVSPTFRPQTINSMERVSRSLSGCFLSKRLWKRAGGFEYRLGEACIKFLSAAPTASVVGATADLLLSVDEAQLVSIPKFEKDFNPMTASTNATRVFWGTAWTADTLLERQRRLAEQAERQDGIRRVFFYTAEAVSAAVPAYAAHVERVIAEHGRDSVYVRSQYFCETIDAQAGMFTPARLALLTAPPLPKGEETGLGEATAFLLDVAGQQETGYDPVRAAEMGEPRERRDSTALSIVAIDFSSLEELEHPTYHVVKRCCWTGTGHGVLFGQIKSLAESWQPQYIVIDATGVGEGLWGMLDRHFPGQVIPVKFTLQEKSEIGWRFMSIIETGRFRDHCHEQAVHRQYLHCMYEILPGAGKRLRWGVPEGRRDEQGVLVHDDFVLADALTAKLDELEWRVSLKPGYPVYPRLDPLKVLEDHY